MFIDDERLPPSNWTNYDFTVCRSVESAIDFCLMAGCPSFISFDHDLGDAPSGYDFAKWLIEQDLNNNGFIPNDFEFVVHSMNPVGRANITFLLTNYLAQRRSV